MDANQSSVISTPDEENLSETQDNNETETSPTSEKLPLSFSDICLENPDANEVDEVATIDITPNKSGGVLKKLVREGEGEENPGYGDKVSVHYTGWLLSKEPKVFDTSRKEEKFEFNLGRGMVIKGWDLGISTMKKGEIALFIVHPKYAYGDMGYPPTIPAFTPLLFEIELFGWKLDDLSPKKDNSILRKVLEKGEGNTLPNEGSRMQVKLTRYNNDDEALEEEEKDFILGEGINASIPEGIEIALFKFHLKEKSLIYLKNKYAPNPEETVESSNTLEPEIKYEVTLINFEKVKEIWEMNSDEKFERAQLAKEKGIQFFKDGHYKTALKQFKWIVTCLEKEPGVTPESQESRHSLLLSGYLNIALCHLKLENYIDAMKVCDKALAIDHDNEKALFRRGQAKIQINDCEEALQDFETLTRLNPNNKAAQNYVISCQNKIKQQKLKDKTTYNKMFDIFKKQDEERLRNMKTETGVWENGKERCEECSDNSDILDVNASLLDANVIEISNTANQNFIV